MPGYSVIFHEGSTIDYNDAYYWYEEQQRNLGEKFLTAVGERISLILDNPDAYGVKAKGRYRETSVSGFPFSIVYLIYRKQRTILIVSIHHHKKHPRKKYRK